jgi:CRP-like cAMP-binding protein
MTLDKAYCWAGVLRGNGRQDLDLILSRARSARFAKNTAIFSQGETATSFFLLLSGHIRVVRSSLEGYQVIARYINEGELFGIAMAMGIENYPATAGTAVDCVVLI